VNFLSILGGEPFLHTRLDMFVSAIKSRYPDTALHLVTNGFWLSQAAVEKFETVFKTVQSIAISIYPNMIKRLGGTKHLAGLIATLQAAYPALNVSPRIQTAFSVSTPVHSTRVITEPTCGQLNCTALLIDGRLSRCSTGAYWQFSRRDLSF